MKKLTTEINGTLAKVIYHVAKKGAGLASWLGWYQPKVPEKLAK